MRVVGWDPQGEVTLLTYLHIYLFAYFFYFPSPGTWGTRGDFRLGAQLYLYQGLGRDCGLEGVGALSPGVGGIPGGRGVRWCVGRWGAVDVPYLAYRWGLWEARAASDTGPPGG